MNLSDFFTSNTKAALAFSGGTDSSFLLYSAAKYGCDIRAYFIKTPFQPNFELEDARRLAEQCGVPLTVVEIDILGNPDAQRNDERRCYYCKTALFTKLWEHARADGYSLLLDGTNASDSDGDRPGMQALRELGVRSPLRECGLTKADIRRLSKEAGLFTHDKPAYSCLATRIPTGTPLDRDSLARVEAGEGALFSLGFSDLRLRKLGQTAKIQLPANQLVRAVEKREEIVEQLSPWFDTILLDLKPR